MPGMALCRFPDLELAAVHLGVMDTVRGLMGKGTHSLGKACGPELQVLGSCLWHSVSWVRLCSVPQPGATRRPRQGQAAGSGSGGSRDAAVRHRTHRAHSVPKTPRPPSPSVQIP